MPSNIEQERDLNALGLMILAEAIVQLGFDNHDTCLSCGIIKGGIHVTDCLVGIAESLSTTTPQVDSLSIVTHRWADIIKNIYIPS